MWPVLVVVVDVVGDELLYVVLVPDDGAGQPFGLLEELSADGSDPAFGERVGHWRADRCLENLESFGSEDLVEGIDELAAAVSNECS
ncbi:MAG: hypothetical protein ACI88C_000710, partial [Acidimicrobiales bacterium]